jgi:4-diphosphocytidyl-2-C-methyl-D-erythritol kinase
VEPRPFVARTLTLLTPPFGCSTPAVYRVWDDLGGPRAAGPNDLEPAALVVEPRLAAVRDELADATGQVPVLAGSGSTWFVEGAFPGDGRVVARTTPAPGG